MAAKSGPQRRAASKAQIEHRRTRVAAHLLAGLNFREISATLEQEFAGDPDVGTSLVTVWSDTRVIVKRWEKEQVETIEQRKRVELRRIDQALKGIWGNVLKGDLPSIDRFIKLSEQRGKIEGWESITLKGDKEHPVRVKGEGGTDHDRFRDIVTVLVEAGVLPAAAVFQETGTGSIH